MKEVVLILAGAVIGFFVSRLQYSINKCRDAKDSFRVFISMQRRSIDALDFYGWHDKTKPEFRDAVSKVVPFLCRWKRPGIDTIWREYQAISHEQLKQENEADWVQEIEALAKAPRTPKPSEILNGFLDRFEKAVK